MNTTPTHHEPEEGLVDPPEQHDSELLANDPALADSDRELDVDSAFRQTRPGSAERHGERATPGGTAAERSWDDGGRASHS